MTRHMRIAAIDAGGTNIKAAVFEDGEIILTKEAPSQPERGGPHFLGRAVSIIEEFLHFDAIGISITGQPDPKSGRIVYANDNIKNFIGIEVKETFETRYNVPAAVVNDVCAAALGEGAHGAAQGESDYICVTYGTGIGGGAVLGGRLYYGAGASAGIMMGGLTLHAEQYKPNDAFSGSYEQYASVTALVRSASELDRSLNNGRAIFARINEPEVKRIVDEWLEEVAAGLCSLIHTFNIPLLVLGGGVMEQPYAITTARELTLKRIIPGFRGVRIVGAQLGNMAGLYGAAELAKDLISGGKA